MIGNVKMSRAHMDLELPSRKRKNSESVKDRLTMAPSAVIKEAKMTEEASEKYDLKYKLQKIREAKSGKRRIFCEACCRSTKDWSNHKFSLEHIQNDKKARCHFCPKRFRLVMLSIITNSTYY